MVHSVAAVQIRWLPPAEGGRQAPPPGPVYAATARFRDDPPEALFSVVIYLADGVSDPRAAGEAELTLLAPDRLPEVGQRLAPGSQLFISEGQQIVAECRILAVRHAPGGSS